MKKNFNVEEINEMYDFLDDVYGYLQDNRGIALLEPMSNRKKEQLYSIVKDYPGLKMSTILDGEDARPYLTIKKHRSNKSYIEVKRKGLKEYQDGDYEACIETFKDIIEKFTYIEANTYEMIGLASYKLGNVEDAVKYLMVSTYVSSLENKPRDYSKFINEQLGINYKKSYLRKNGIEPGDVFYGKEFRMNERDNYGIKGVEKIKEYAAKHHMTMEEAFTGFNLTNEEKDMVKLIMAREYYEEGNFKDGNMYLNSVAETPGKTERVMKAMEDIRSKREFYQFRDEVVENAPVYSIRYSYHIKPGKRTN